MDQFQAFALPIKSDYGSSKSTQTILQDIHLLCVYKWTDRRGEHCKSTAREVLAEFGFNTYWGTSRRRVPSVVLINVRTNVPEWLGAAGKTHINLIPYAETIAKALCTMSYNIPSYHGQGYVMVYEPSYSEIG